MKILLYIPKESDAENLFFKMFDKLIPSGNAQVYNRFDDLSDRLRKPTSDITFAIFLITDTKDLSALISMEPWFSGLRIILVLPDRRKETLNLAYKLFPRYVCDLNGKYEDLSLVIQKMTKTYQ